MKEIKAFIQPFMLQKITDALHLIHVSGMSVSEIRGFGKETDEGYPHHSNAYVAEFTHKIKIEIVCQDDEVDKILDAIQKNGHTGRKGDGKVYVTAVDRVVSIRTGEVNEKAI